MIERTFESNHFFDHFPRFVETSETGPWLDRLNARYFALIHSNRELIRGARILDLASHDGRFSFAALQSGASRVVGIEHKPRLVRKSQENMEFYDVPTTSYDFVLGDIFERIDEVEPCDVVLCFGLFYHINHHMLLLSKIAELEPRRLIIDTRISQLDGLVVELHHEPPGRPWLVGAPSRTALEAMFSSFGWTFEYFDWQGYDPTAEHLADYRTGRRVSAVVACDHQFERKARRATGGAPLRLPPEPRSTDSR